MAGVCGLQEPNVKGGVTNSEVAPVTLVAVAAAAVHTASWLTSPACYGLGKESIQAI